MSKSSCQSPDHLRIVAAAVAAVASDIQLAAVSELPVLISGDPVASRAVALELDRVGRSRCGAVEVVDCRLPGALEARPLRTRPGRSSVLLLQEVHALSSREQLLLEQQLDDILQLPPDTRIRVVASSSAPLYDRVIDERFRERLFYRLNMVHIVVPAGGDQEELVARES
jgi:sigma54-dependent transcription regulator